MTDGYDPFARGPLPVGVRTDRTYDAARDRWFPCEVWYPAAAEHAGEDLDSETQDRFAVPSRDGTRGQAAVRDAAARAGVRPLVLFSHAAGYDRRASTFLCTHVASHGYVVAALDHSEVVAPELARRAGETAEQTATRVDGLISSRVPDVRLLLDHVLHTEHHVDPARIGIVGHSIGGWTALAAPEVEPRIRAVVALAPAGTSRPRPGILPATLTFDWGRDIPTLYLAAENDTAILLDGLYELFDRTEATKRMVILRRADHAHFFDDVAREHETIRAMPFPEELSWMKEMRPISELCPPEHAHVFARGLTVCHLDAALRGHDAAARLLAGDLRATLAAHGIEATVHEPS